MVRFRLITCLAVCFFFSIVPLVAADVSSDFEDGTLQGWVSVDNGGGGIWNPGSGGNPGGCLRAQDIQAGKPCYVVAPSQYLGNWHSKIGISADLVQFTGSGGNYLVQMQLSGPGGSYTRTFSTSTTTTWKTFQTLLDESLWVCNSGSWDALLDNVTDFRIMMDYRAGTEECGLDNVLVLDSGTLASIPVAKQMPDGQKVRITGVVSRVASNYMYIERPDRASGIKVNGSFSVAEGSTVDLYGFMATHSAERSIDNVIIVSSQPGEVPGPFGITSKELGGIGLSPLDPTLGSSLSLKETGLLVRLAGLVCASDGKGSFVLDDGGQAVCVCSSASAIPVIGSFIVVTGVSAGFGDSDPFPAVLMVRDEYQYLKLPLGVNLIRNGGAEEGLSGTDGALASPVAGWTTTGNFTATNYGYIYPASESDRVGGGGKFFFGGLNCAASQATQDIDISCLADEVDTGTLDAVLSGYLGGRDTEGDTATVVATFYDASGMGLGALQIGPQKGGNVWTYREMDGSVPIGTRKIQVAMIGNRINGSNCDAFFDNLSLVLQ